MRPLALNTLLMKRQILLLLLTSSFFLNPLLFFSARGNSATILWTGNSTADPTNWSDPTNWLNLDTGEVPTSLPEDADMMIDGLFNVYISGSVVTGSIQLSGGAKLFITASGNLTTQEGGLDGSHGIRLDVASPNTNYPDYITGNKSGDSALFVYGVVNINVAAATNMRAPKSGLFIGASTSATVYENASLNIIVAASNGIEMTGALSNYGTITITDSTDKGILLNSENETTYGSITNEESGTIVITGGAECMSFRSHTIMVNYGNVKLSEASSGTVIEAGSPWAFTNNGTFQGDGLVERTRFFTHGQNSVLIPGSSTGCLIFDNRSTPVELSGVTLLIEIDGINACSQYDQFSSTGSGGLDLDGAVLNLIFGENASVTSPVNIVQDVSGGITNSFSSVVSNNPDYMLSYLAGSVEIEGTGSLVPVESIFGEGRPLAIHPTLARDVVFLEWPDAPAGEYTVEVFNLAGQSVYSNQAAGQAVPLPIQVEDWRPGMYWVLVRRGGELSAGRFIKQ